MLGVMHKLMNRLLITLIALLATTNLPGQVQNDAKKILATKDFLAFKNFADNLSNRDKRISSHWECLRDLTTDFQEGVFIIENSAQDKNNPGINFIYTYRVTVVTTKTKIAFYELTEMKNKKVGNDWEPYYAPIDKFTDEKLYNSLKNAFRGLFKTELNERELFVTDLVYGEHCGFAGTNPKGRQQVDAWVANKNRNELLKWLKSTNTEKQIYAVDGLYQLKNVWTQLNDEEIKMINFVTKKNGTVNVCSGCIHSRDDIRDVTKKFGL